MFARAKIISIIKYGLRLYGVILPILSFYGEAHVIGCKVIYKKIKIALNHVARVIINYNGKYEDLGIRELYCMAGLLSFNQLSSQCTLLFNPN